VSEADKAKLRAITKAVGGGAHFVDTIASLNEVLEWALSFDPAKKEALKQIDDVVELVLAPVGPLNDFGDQLNLSNFDEARKLLEAAQALLKNGNERFDALGKTRPSANFQRLYQLAAEARSFHQSDLQVGQELLEYGEESGGRPARPPTVDKWNAAIGQWQEHPKIQCHPQGNGTADRSTQTGDQAATLERSIRAWRIAKFLRVHFKSSSTCQEYVSLNPGCITIPS
jgi:hypothetical protein